MSVQNEPLLPLFVPISQERPPAKRGKNIQNLCSDEDFEAFWRTCPRRVGKGAARKAYIAARKKTDADTLLRQMTLYCLLCQRRNRDPERICYPATWLNQERWLDEDTDAAGSGYRLNGHAPRGRADTILAAGLAAGARARSRQ